MREATGRFSSGVWLALGLALAWVPARAGELKLVVSAVVLDRVTCGPGSHDARVAIETAVPALRCTRSDPAADLRIRTVKGRATSPAGARAGPGADPVILIIEP